MKKSKISALLAAGAVVFLAPSAANANDLGPLEYDDGQSTLTTNTGGDSFTSLTTSGTAELTIKANAGNPLSGGTTTMEGTSQIILSPAVADVTFSSTTVTGTNNIIQMSSTSGGTANIGSTIVSSGAKLTLENLSTGGTLKTNGAVSLNGGTLVTTGKTVTVEGINVTENSEIDTNSGSVLGTVNVYANRQVTVSDVNVGSNVTKFTLNNGSEIITKNGGQNLGNLDINTSNTITGKAGTTTIGTASLGEGEILNLTIDSSDENAAIQVAVVDASTSTSEASLVNTGAVTIGINAGDAGLKLANGVNFKVESTSGTTLINKVTGASDTSNKNLTLNANGGMITVANQIALAGSNDVLNLQGNQKITLNGISSSGTKTTITNTNTAPEAADLGDITVEAGSTLDINAKTTTTFDNAELKKGGDGTAGHPKTILNLVTNYDGGTTGSISGDEITMNGNATVNKTGTGAVTLTDGIVVNDTGNTISIAAGSGTDLETITMGNSDSINTAGVAVSGLYASGTNKNFDGFKFNGTNAATNDTISTTGINHLGDMTLSKKEQTLEISSGGNDTIGNVTMVGGTGTTEATKGNTVTLKNTESDLSAGTVNMNGYNTLNIDNATVTSVVAKNAGNSVVGQHSEKTNNSIGSVSFAAGGTNNKLSLSNVDVTSASNISQKGTIESTNTSFSSLNVTAGNSGSNAFTLNAKIGTTGITTSSVSANQNMDVVTATGTTASIGTLKMNGNATEGAYSTVAFSGDGTKNITTSLNVTGSNNKISNSGSSGLTIKQVDYQANNSDVEFTGSGITILASGTGLTLSGTTNGITNSTGSTMSINQINQQATSEKAQNTLNMKGDFNVTNVGFKDGNNGGLLTLNAKDDGTDVTITNFTRQTSTGENPTPINAALNADTGATITKTTATTLYAGDSLAIGGTGNVVLGSGVTTNGGSLTIANANTTIGGGLVIAKDDTFKTVPASVTSTTPVTTITTDSLTVGTSSDDTATWNFLFNAKDKEADSIKFTDGEGHGVTADSGKLDITMSVNNDVGSSNFVEYVTLVDDPDKSVLATTIDGDNYYKHTDITGGGSYYYSYVDPADKVPNHNYVNNRIRVTNYIIDRDTLLDALTKEGTRTWTEEDAEPTSAHYAAATGNTNLPNVQASSYFEDENVLSVINRGYISGYAGPTNVDPDTGRSQLFVVDTTDGVDRALNIQGTPLYGGLSDASDHARVENSGNGAALHVESDETNLAPAAVTLTSYTSNYAGEPYTTQPAFVSNQAIGDGTDDTTGNGGAIYAVGAGSTIAVVPSTTGDVSVELTVRNNVAENAGGAIYNADNASIVLASDNLVNDNTAGTSGGAIYNENAEMLIGSDESANIFSGNRAGAVGQTVKIYDEETTKVSYSSEIVDYSAAGGDGGAIANVNGGEIVIAGNTTFDRNIAGSLVSEAAGISSDGGAIYNDNARILVGSKASTNLFNYNEAFGNGGAVASVSNHAGFLGDTTFVDNIATGNGGAIYADGANVNLSGSQTFTDNLSEGKGGAIYGKNANINITAVDGKTTLFSGNKQKVKYATVPKGSTQELDPHCGHVIDTTTGKHVIDSYESNAIYLDGGANLNLKTTGTGAIVFDDKIASSDKPSNITNSITQHGDVYYNTDMSGYSGMFDLTRSSNAYFTHADAVPFQKGDYKLDGGTLLAMKNGKIIPVHAHLLDLSGTTKDNPARFTIDLNLANKTSDKFILKTPAKGYISVTDMNIEGDTSEKSVFYKIANGADVSTPLKRYDTELYKYNVSGQKSGILFERQGLHAPLVAPQVAVNARLAGQLDLFDDLLHRVDEIAQDRHFYKSAKENLYAADPDVLDDRRIDNGYTPYVNQMDGGSAWMKPSFTIEKINPKGYNKYHNKAYNTILGYEAPVATLRNNWDLISTVFAGYQGSHQSYDDMSNYQNGGTAGYMANLYHKNFFAGGVVMLGGTAVQTTDKSHNNRDMNYGLFDVGASARVGYNIGLGKHWLFQPKYTMSYIYISGVDRHNHRGQHIDLKGTNTLQISPGFELVGNYGGWQPYLLFDYTWPCIAKTVANVNDIGIPDLKLRSYVEYGVGLRKNLGERFTGYLQAIMRNGGRTGVSFQGGLTFKF